MTKDEAGELMKRGNWLATLPGNLADELVASAMIMRAEPGQLVYRLGDSPGGLYGVVTGSVRVEIETPRDSSKLIGILQRGAWMGHRPSFLGKTHRTATLRAVGDCVLLNVSLASVRELLSRGPDWALALASLMDWYVRIAEVAISDLMIPELRQRVAATLLRMANYPFGLPGDGGWLVPLTQSDLAEVANCSRDNIRLAMADFRARGWVENKYRSIRVLEPKALREFAYEESGDPA
ncbi:MAG: Crp/Fnr family transcriptional regulator [Erythrobacter sp.]|uniref:Crp/Fnr family transcriptional regulator n=1 Tax=Erythrobacter sp. TaxID=1042 RepID=UPI002631D88C|nr:Crp/Fnr family transcriptional regulator [Erythrobacter sp.]MDJ0978671.1 Crp/Fnr family transcriptional regulator [Erythrobacter sp.]